MKILDCEATRGRLDAFHDGELSVSDQIAVADHLEWCRRCASAAAEICVVAAALQTMAAGQAAMPYDEAAAFGAAVVNRLKAECEASLIARVRLMFDDMHLLYAGFGAAAATMACMVILLGMMKFASHERPDSLAAIVNLLATPLECEPATEAPDVSDCRARWAERFQRANESVEQDAVFTLDSLVTRHGPLASLAVLRASRHTPEGEAELIEGLLDTVCRARLDTPPNSSPLSGNMLWVVARTSVRVTRQQASDFQLPAKKRAASAPHTLIIA